MRGRAVPVPACAEPRGVLRARAELQPGEASAPAKAAEPGGAHACRRAAAVKLLEKLSARLSEEEAARGKGSAVSAGAAGREGASKGRPGRGELAAWGFPTAPAHTHARRGPAGEAAAGGGVRGPAGCGRRGRGAGRVRVSGQIGAGTELAVPPAWGDAGTGRGERGAGQAEAAVALREGGAFREPARNAAAEG